MTPAEAHTAGLALEAARIAYGLSMLRRHSTMDRLLGGRLVLQGAGTIWLGGEPAVHGCGGLVDTLHAVSMVGLAVGSRRRRRLGMRASLAASAFAAAEAWCARSRS